MPTATVSDTWAPSCTTVFLEPLEDRIAPATINAGPDLLPPIPPADQAQQVGGVGYVHDGFDAKGNIVETPFYSTDSAPNASIAALFSSSVDPNHYYVTLKKGDTLKIYNPAQGVGFEPFIQVTGGEIIAFFTDFNTDGQVGKDELTGLSLGAGAKVSVSGSVDGDILTNYNSKTKDVSATSLISNKQSIAGLFVSGDVNGQILAGGNITNVTVVGNVQAIKTGSATDGYLFDFGAGDGGSDTLGTFLAPGVKQVGASISKVSVGSIDTIEASNGGLSSAGGSLSSIYIVSDANGFTLKAGDGGAGAPGSVSGGKGGSVATVYVYGAQGSPTDPIHIQAGDGGAGLNGGTVFGNGGAGGTLSNVFVGYQPVGKTLVLSGYQLSNHVLLEAGDGGDGKAAGAGGLVKGVKIATSTANDPTPGTYELEVRGGDGGNSNAFLTNKTVAGVGGAVSSVEIRNFEPNALDASLLVAGGDAGLAYITPTQGGSGNKGGAVSGVTALGFDIAILGGQGSDGYTNGGAGGAIASLNVETFGNIFTDDLLVQAGDGGMATIGNAGAGGAVSKLTFGNLDLQGTSAILAGVGGTSTLGRGGIGGSISSVTLNDVQPKISIINFVAGAGGDGAKGGVAGGSISNVTLVGVNSTLNFVAGAGGDANGSASAVGGAGGVISTVSASVSGFAGPLSISVTAGMGGDSIGKAKAGNGGYIFAANLTAVNDINLLAGSGGAASASTSGGTSGVGGYIKSSGIDSLAGATSMIAGNGGILGALGVRGGAGGAITGATAIAATNIVLLAGDGTSGGAGGGISNSTFLGQGGGAPSGAVNIEAGDGSGFNALAGAGGSLIKLIGFASGSASDSTFIKAGNAGTGTKGGANGGGISNLTLMGGGASEQLTIWAGDGGSAAAAGKGGAGGSIAGVNIADGVTVTNLVAGNGGDSASKTGGLGGSVSKVYSQGDIGYRSDVVGGFGFDDSVPANYYSHSGGIFAGTGGENTFTNVRAKAGSVVSVTADAISSIIAGRGVAFALTAANLVTTVDQIYLNGLLKPQAQLDGSYTNWGTANFVGGIAGDPSAAGANVYQTDSGDYLAPWLLGTTVPLDGLIAALNLGVKRNFEPNAFLSLDSTGVAQFAGSRVN